MNIVTITPIADPRWPEMKPITLRNPTTAVLGDIIRTFVRNNVGYRVTYSDSSKPFKYPLAASFISR
jgi:hypothetical protein